MKEIDYKQPYDEAAEIKKLENDTKKEKNYLFATIFERRKISETDIEDKQWVYGEIRKSNDPDSHSKELYKDWEKFIKGQLPTLSEEEFRNLRKFFSFESGSKHDPIQKKNGSYCLAVTTQSVTKDRKKKYTYANWGTPDSGAKWVVSSDYIGASAHWAKKASIDSKRFYKHLKIARLLGGHMLFPKSRDNNNGKKLDGKNESIIYETINQSRGGNIYFDRFDLTLLAIKDCYTNKKIDFMKINNIHVAIKNYNYYFDLFGEGLNGFKNFINFFELNEFVRKDSLDIINLLCSNLKNEKIKYLSHYSDITPSAILEKNNYERYMTNLEILILNRTKKMLKIISKE